MKYRFDVQMNVTLEVDAPNEDEARTQVKIATDYLKFVAKPAIVVAYTTVGEPENAICTLVE